MNTIKLKESEKALFTDWDKNGVKWFVHANELGIDIDTEEFEDVLSFPDDEDFNFNILKVLLNPDYFWWTCKYIFNVNLIPMQHAVLRELWTKKYPMLIASRGFSKSYTLALYCLMRMLFEPGCKVVVCGAGFRQSKIIFEYMEKIWSNAPMLRDMAGSNRQNGSFKNPDEWVFKIGQSTCTAIPIGQGDKIRGKRANYLITDEFSSIVIDIYQRVLEGFQAVSANPVENVMKAALKKIIESQGKSLINNKDEDFGNQAIISGTAYYSFNHFCDYWKNYKNYIKSKGDKNKLLEVLTEIHPKFNWKDFSVIRIPYELIPEGFMDDVSVARSKATGTVGIYQMEYGATFTNDSNGFFKRTLIESCVVSKFNQISFPSGEAFFPAVLRGHNNRRYVYGIDPAAESDNFAIVVLELWPEHRRVVHAWTTTRKKFRERMGAKITDQDFYEFVNRKIRDLMRIFPCEAIAIDTQGGGLSVEEVLHVTKDLKEGELAIWPTIDPEKEKPTDRYPGLHILHMINFASAEWTNKANHDLLHDLQNKTLLFPFFDAISISMAKISDEIGQRDTDDLEDCVMEIEELKDELCTIEHTQVGVTMRDRWDTPEIKLPGQKKGRLRKDRYSALLMANAVARQMFLLPPEIPYTCVGGFVNNLANQKQDGAFATGPDWYTKGYENIKHILLNQGRQQ